MKTYLLEVHCYNIDAPKRQRFYIDRYEIEANDDSDAKQQAKTIIDNHLHYNYHYLFTHEVIK